MALVLHLALLSQTHFYISPLCCPWSPSLRRTKVIYGAFRCSLAEQSESAKAGLTFRRALYCALKEPVTPYIDVSC